MTDNIDAALSRIENVVEPISTNELERRWKEVRGEMSKKELNFLVVQGTYRYMGGYVRWFTDIAAELYPVTVLFPAEGEMILIGTSAPDWLLRGVKEQISVLAPLFPLAHAEKILDVFKAENPSRVGLVDRDMGGITVTTYDALTKGLPNVKFEDATDMVDQIKAVKSEEELRLIQKSADMHDLGIEAAREAVKPGKRVYEVMAEVRHSLKMAGSEEQWLMAGSAPAGTPIHSGGLAYGWNRTLKEGDMFTILIESSGPGGFYTELAREICLGRIPKEEEKKLEEGIELQKLLVGMLNPGADPIDIWNAYSDFYDHKGYPRPKRFGVHAQGYALVERPIIQPPETMKLKAGMNLNLPHWPEPTSVSVMANYIITETGAKRIHKTPEEIFVI